jgi:Fungal N-terminal domain of STAND proteins
MEPLSIATGCASVLATITKVSLAISHFVKGVRGARSDLDAVTRELSSLRIVLELVEEDAKAQNHRVPEELRLKIVGLIGSCGDAVEKIAVVVEKHSCADKLLKGVDRHAKWVMGGKDEVNGLKGELAGHTVALEMALSVLNISIAQEIKSDTEGIKSDTQAIKSDTEGIRGDTEVIREDTDALRHHMALMRDEIACLKEQLSRREDEKGGNLVLQRFLDDMTSYAETVVGDVEDEDRMSTPRASLDVVTEVDENEIAAVSNAAFPPPNRNAFRRGPAKAFNSNKTGGSLKDNMERGFQNRGETPKVCITRCPRLSV